MLFRSLGEALVVELHKRIEGLHENFSACEGMQFQSSWMNLVWNVELKAIMLSKRFCVKYTKLMYWS